MSRTFYGDAGKATAPNTPKVGQIVRYGEGPTALMRVSSISENHGGFGDLCCGVQFYGGVVCAYVDKIYEATPDEVARFEAERKS